MMTIARSPYNERLRDRNQLMKNIYDALEEAASYCDWCQTEVVTKRDLKEVFKAAGLEIE